MTTTETEECKHPVVIKEEHLTGEGAMEFVEWYDCYCTACGEKWTENEQRAIQWSMVDAYQEKQ